jgi:hypothetical protein
MKLLGIIGVGFDVTNQLLITYLPSSDTEEKWEYKEKANQLFLDFEKAYD